MGIDILYFLGTWLTFAVVTIVVLAVIAVGIGAALDIRDYRRRPYR